MRTDSHRLAGTLVALGFVAGWFSGSWVSPPTAITQTRPARPVATTPDVPMPRIALAAVTARDETPAANRNPFVFGARPVPTREIRARRDADPAEEMSTGEAATSDLAPAITHAPAPPGWRVVGIAAEADGRMTAVVSGAGDILLLALGDRLPDGSRVETIDASGVVVATPAGERVSLRLP